MIDLLPNETVVLQWLIFVAVLLLLNRSIFRPVLKVLEARRDRIGGDRERADRFREEAGCLLNTCDQKIEEARLQGIREKELRRQEGERRQAEILKSVRTEIENDLNRLRGETEKASREALVRLRQESQEIGRLIASKILEREI